VGGGGGEKGVCCGIDPIFGFFFFVFGCFLGYGQGWVEKIFCVFCGGGGGRKWISMIVSRRR